MGHNERGWVIEGHRNSLQSIIVSRTLGGKQEILAADVYLTLQTHLRIAYQGPGTGSHPSTARRNREWRAVRPGGHAGSWRCYAWSA